MSDLSDFKRLVHDPMVRGLEARIRELEAIVAGSPSTVGGSARTSKQAARQALPRSGTNRMKVLKRIAEFPATDQEIAQSLGMQGNSVRPRRGELVKASLVEDMGITRKAPGGAECIVWRATPAGHGVANRG